MTQLNELETPALVLDRTTMERNINRLRDHLSRFDVVLRPHVKTNKSAEVAFCPTMPVPLQPSMSAMSS